MIFSAGGGLLFPAVSLSLTIAAAAFGASNAEWRNVDASTGRISNRTELARLAEDFPNSGSVELRRLSGALELGDAAELWASLVRLAEMGYALSPASLEQLSAHLSADQAEAIGRRFEENRRPVTASHVYAVVPRHFRLIEGVAWDGRTRRLFASSVVDRALLVREGDEWRALDGVARGSVFGMAVDPARRLLWIASGSAEQVPPGEEAFRGLIAVDLDRLVATRNVPSADDLGDLTVAADGTVFASAPATGVVYRLRPGHSDLVPLVPAGRLRSPQGLALSRDQRLIYVADYRYGVAVIERAGGAIRRLEANAPTMLDGIDGLSVHQGALIAIQNGVSPQRIVRLDLDSGGTRVLGFEILEQGHADWGEPTLGAVADDMFLYVADAQWSRFGASGTSSGEPSGPTPIRALRLRAARPAAP